MYILGAIVATFVIVQSIVFLVRAWKQGVKIGMSRKTLWGAVKNSAIFSIVPSVSIAIGVLTMSRALGVPLPWIRLSVVGSVTYELPAAEQAATAMGMVEGLADPNFNMSVFAGVVLVMSVGIIWGLLLCLFGGLNILDKRMGKMKNTDKKWGELFVTSLFMGLVATFCGYIITPPIVDAIKQLNEGSTTWAVGFASILTLITSAILMLIFTKISEKNKKMKWLEGFALPFSMIISMGAAIAYTIMLGGSI
jgi:hypothetical protein